MVIITKNIFGMIQDPFNPGPDHLIRVYLSIMYIIPYIFTLYCNPWDTNLKKKRCPFTYLAES